MNHGRSNPQVPEVQLPITPFLDMAFQLMFFFLATFSPPSVKEGQLNLALSPDSVAAAVRPPLQDPRVEPKEEPERDSELTVSLRGYKDPRSRGLVSAMTVTTLAGNEELPGTPEDREKLLSERLAAARPADGGKPPTVRVSAESDVHWSQVVRIMDLCDRAGFQIRFSKPPDLGAGQ